MKRIVLAVTLAIVISYGIGSICAESFSIFEWSVLLSNRIVLLGFILSFILSILFAKSPKK